MEEIREIGIEKEIFLTSNGVLREPKKYGFPRDEFEFLVELRSLPSDRLYPVYTTLQAEELQYSLRANKFGMKLDDCPVKFESKKWVDDLWERHNLDRFKDCDYTRNVYPELGRKQSHHFGRFDFSKDQYKLTAGIHVHFSSRDADTGEVIDLPIEKIVKQMDIKFYDEVTQSGRNRGEWEPKPHGFEYRSLPANADIYKVLKVAFNILREA
jgi:hypothetical protein